MTPQLRTALAGQYDKARNWQTRHGIQFDLTFEDFIALWSPSRLHTLQTKLDRSQKSLDAFLTHPTMKPVCGWVSKEAKALGIMDASTAKIMRAEDSKRMFQFKKGDKHTAETIEGMKRPKSDATKAKMKAKAEARWARVREENAAQQGGQV